MRGNRNILITFIVGLVLLLGLAIALNNKRTGNSQTAGPSPTVADGNAPSRGAVSPTSADTSGNISPTQSANEDNIVVDSPQANEEVGREFTVSGEARVFENVFQVRVTHNDSGTIVYNQNAMADAADTGQFGDFDVEVTLPERTTTNVPLQSGDELTLEVFQFSAKDGTEIDKVTIPLTLSL